MKPESTAKARSVKKRYERDWLAIDGVVAVGIGIRGGTACVVVSVVSDPVVFSDSIPADVEGVPVVIEKSGTIGLV